MIALVCAALDGTLLGNAESSERFLRVWRQIDRRRRPLLVYNTGRSVDDTRTLIEHGVLPAPDVIIGGAGTELHEVCDPSAAQEFQARFGEGWDRPLMEKIVRACPGIVGQPPDFLQPSRSSWCWENATPSQFRALKTSLSKAGIHATVVYSESKYLDILPADADRGKALDWICRRRGVPLAQVLVAGDTTKDTSMLMLPDVGRILIGNGGNGRSAAFAALSGYRATAAMADGVIEGLKHYGVI